MGNKRNNMDQSSWSWAAEYGLDDVSVIEAGRFFLWEIPEEEREEALEAAASREIWDTIWGLGGALDLD